VSQLRQSQTGTKNRPNKGLIFIIIAIGEDIEITRRLVEAGKLLQAPVLDHIISGEGEYSSLKEKGLL
jgi:hypothetical protein